MKWGRSKYRYLKGIENVLSYIAPPVTCTFCILKYKKLLFRLYIANLIILFDKCFIHTCKFTGGSIFKGGHKGDQTVN